MSIGERTSDSGSAIVRCAPNSVFVQVEGDHGWTTWTPVESLDDVGAEGAVYVLDREVGELNLRRRQAECRPAARAGVQANYGYGVGGSVPERTQ